MKWLLAVAMTMVASVALAQTCDVSLCTTVVVAQGEEKMGDGCINWYGLPGGKGANSGPNTILTRSVKVIEALQKEEGKDGPLTVRLKGTNSCDKSGAPNEVEAQGVTYQGATKVLRVEMKLGDELLKIGEGRVAKGKHPWKD